MCEPSEVRTGRSGHPLDVRHADWTRLEAVLTGIATDHHRSLDRRHEVLRLWFEVPGPAQIPEVGRARAPNGFVYLDLAGVVGCLGQLPRAVPNIEVVEVSGGSHGGLVGVEALVN